MLNEKTVGLLQKAGKENAAKDPKHKAFSFGGLLNFLLNAVLRKKKNSRLKSLDTDTATSLSFVCNPHSR